MNPFDRPPAKAFVSNIAEIPRQEFPCQFGGTQSRPLVFLVVTSPVEDGEAPV